MCRVVLGVCLPVLLAGCDLAPRYHVPLTPVPVAYKEAAPWRPAAPAEGVERGPWWRVLGNPTLDRLETRLDAANPTLAAAFATYQRSRALAAETRSGLFPSLGVDGQIHSERQSNRRPRRGLNQPNSYPDDFVDTRASYQIDLWGKVANEIRSGRDLAQAAAADLAGARLALQADLAEQYVALCGLDAEAGILARAVSVFGQAAQLTRNRFAGKIAPLMDVTRAESALEDARAQQSALAARRAARGHAIAVMVGSPPAALDLPPQPWVLDQPAPAPGLPATLLERRPDIAAAERQVAAANAHIGVARAAFYPAVSLDLLYGLQATGLNVFSLPNSFWSVGPGFALPLFEGGLRDAELASALSARDITVARYRETVLEAFGDVEDQLSALRLLAQEQRRRERAASAADRTLAMADALYRDGATNFLDVVVAQNAALNAEKAVIGVRTQRMQAGIGLIRALGGGWDRGQLPGRPAIEASLDTTP